MCEDDGLLGTALCSRLPDEAIVTWLQGSEVPEESMLLAGKQAINAHVAVQGSDSCNWTDTVDAESGGLSAA